MKNVIILMCSILMCNLVTLARPPASCEVQCRYGLRNPRCNCNPPTPPVNARTVFADAWNAEDQRRIALGWRNLIPRETFNALQRANNVMNDPALNFIWNANTLGLFGSFRDNINRIFGAGSDRILSNLSRYNIPLQAVTEARCLNSFVHTIFNDTNIQNQAWACDPIQNTIRNMPIQQLARVLDDPSISQNLATNILNNYWTGNGHCAPFINSYVNHALRQCPGSVVHQCQHLFNRSCPEASAWARRALRTADYLCRSLGINCS
jgi:hypothetical protein